MEGVSFLFSLLIEFFILFTQHSIIIIIHGNDKQDETNLVQDTPLAYP